ncbi:MAG: gliding motility-associated C-terminal domain-containing protein [Lewinellaceae bacterium]|nr:gliding motility-associated C-terminal domain-containing protein [Lewinellaceae bacterium]
MPDSTRFFCALPGTIFLCATEVQRAMSFRLHTGRRMHYVSLTMFWMFLGSGFQGFAQPFQKLYTNPTGTFFTAQDICSDTMQGHYITGGIQGAQPQTFVFKTDMEGQLVWSKKWTAADTDYNFQTGLSIKTTFDNGLIISSLKEKNGIVTGGILLKTTASGDLEWSKSAPCIWRNSEVCPDEGHVYYASEGKGVRKAYIGKISNEGQVLWERWLEAGAMDFYTVESLVRCGNGDIVVALLVSKFENGALIGPEQTVLFRIDPAGTVQQVAFFPVVHLAALTPLSDGRIAFRCSASDVTWTGMGLMDEQFNCLWFKKAGLGVTVFLPNIISQELAVSSDESRIFGIFYTVGGEKIALAFDTDGNLLQEEVYFSGPFAEQAFGAKAKGYVRASGIRTDAFVITGSNVDGAAFEDCFFSTSCGLQLRDTTLQSEAITWQSNPAACLEDESAISTDMALTVADYCVDTGPTDAGFHISDTLICTGASIDVQRFAGITPPVFGVSEWSFEGGLPARATGATAYNIRFNQAGTYTVRHIFTVAGCRDTAFARITVTPPPVLDLGSDTTLCPGDTILFHAGMQASGTFLWNTGDSSAWISVSVPGFYAVTLTQSGSCTTTDAVDVRFFSAADVSLGPDTILCPETSIRLSAPETAAGQTLTWSTGASGTTLDVLTPGLYALQLSTFGCVFSDTILVQASDCSECRVYAPNVFAPESAGQGRRFQLFPSCPLLAGRWRIYDRWGNLLFESSDLNAGWDGRLNGKTLPPGVYLYDADLQLAPVQRPVEWRKVSGSVALLR